jgi:hypothetical protein
MRWRRTVIKYNLRYRGPLEYDKFLLTILQFCNEVKYLEKGLDKGDLNLLVKDEDKFNKIMNGLIGEDGLMQKLAALKLKTESYEE